MSKNFKISGKITSIYGDDINTDDIIPAYTLQESTDRKYFAKHAFEKFDTKFVERCKNEKANIIIAGENFACGSSREQAVYAIQENDVVAVIAKSYPDIFYRNSLNNGLIVIVVDNTDEFQINDEITIDLDKKIVIKGNKKYDINISDDDVNTFKAGGKLEIIRNDLIKIINNQLNHTDYTKSNLKLKNPQTIAEKIISDHVGKEIKAGDKIKKLPIDLIYFNEVIGPPAIEYFHEFFDKTFEKAGVKPQVFNK